MAIVEFFEKPGCQTNTRQKVLLREAGHEVVERNLLTTPWTPASLRPYFGRQTVASWFNRSAPAIKQGEILPERLSEEQALTLMLAAPLLIKRPLLRVGQRCCAGFESAELLYLGLDITPGAQLNRCAKDSAKPEDGTQHSAPTCPSPVAQENGTMNPGQ
jgi:nitrogenase-associated protein